MTMRAYVVAALLIMTAPFLVACGSTDHAAEDSSTQKSAGLVRIDDRVRHGNVLINYQPYDSVGQVAVGKDVVAAGEVVSVKPGPVMALPVGEGEDDITFRSVVIVKVTKSFSAGAEPGDKVNVIINGGQLAVPAGTAPQRAEVPPQAVVDMQELRAAFNPGRHVIVMADVKAVDAIAKSNAQSVVERGPDLDGAVVSGLQPQEFTIEQPDESMTDWPKETYESMLTALASANL